MQSGATGGGEHGGRAANGDDGRVSEPVRRRLFIDGHNLALDQGTGVATYARNLSFALGRLGFGVGVLYGTRPTHSVDPLIREIAFFDERVGEAPQWIEVLRRAHRMVTAPFGERAVRVPITGQVIATTFRDRLPHFDEIWNAQHLFQQAHAYFRVAKGPLTVRMPKRPDLMHWTYPLPVHMPRVQNIYTLHDLVPLRLPYTTLDHKRRYFRLARHIARRAAHIVTVSENSRRDIINLLGVPEERVTNTWQSVEIPRRLAEAPMQSVRAEVAGSFGLEAGRYWLFFGAIEPKKNVGRMIQAFLASGAEGPLVIVGKKAWKSEGELKLLFDDHVRFLVQEGQEIRRRHKVMLLDYAPFRLLVSLIRGARAVLFPSLYEGFGLPALEAMLLGTPVVTSNTSSMPEVVGDAAISVDPYDVSALVRAIQAVDGDAELRARLAAAGPRRAAQFSPERYAARLEALYGRLGLRAERPTAAEAGADGGDARLRAA
jgi:glycosyltransferase involved in cell wall biosynthesis